MATQCTRLLGGDSVILQRLSLSLTHTHAFTKGSTLRVFSPATPPNCLKACAAIGNWPHHIVAQQAEVQLPVGPVWVLGCMRQAARPENRACSTAVVACHCTAAA